MKFLSNDYCNTNPTTNPKTLTTLTLTNPHNAFESFCAPIFCDYNAELFSRFGVRHRHFVTKKALGKTHNYERPLQVTSFQTRSKGNPFRCSITYPHSVAKLPGFKLRWLSCLPSATSKQLQGVLLPLLCGSLVDLFHRDPL